MILLTFTEYIMNKT